MSLSYRNQSIDQHKTKNSSLYEWIWGHGSRDVLLNKEAIEEAEHVTGEYITNIFTRDKRIGNIKIILKLNK